MSGYGAELANRKLLPRSAVERVSGCGSRAGSLGRRRLNGGVESDGLSEPCGGQFGFVLSAVIERKS
jgi:hypothetical protein